MTDEIKKGDIMDLPVVTIRRLAEFPKSVKTFDIGRERSVKAIETAVERDQYILIVSQDEKNTTILTPEDLRQIGTVGRLMKVQKLKSGTLRLIVKGIGVGEIEEFLSTEPYFECRVKLVTEDVFTSTTVAQAVAAAAPVQAEKTELESPDVRRKVGAVKPMRVAAVKATDTVAGAMAATIEEQPENVVLATDEVQKEGITAAVDLRSEIDDYLSQMEAEFDNTEFTEAEAIDAELVETETAEALIDEDVDFDKVEVEVAEAELVATKAAFPKKQKPTDQKSIDQKPINSKQKKRKRKIAIAAIACLLIGGGMAVVGSQVIDAGAENQQANNDKKQIMIVDKESGVTETIPKDSEKAKKATDDTATKKKGTVAVKKTSAAHQHTWTAVYKTVEKNVGTQIGTKTVCNGCGENVTYYEASHANEYAGIHDVTTREEPVYTYNLVKEKVLSGYKCSCGATKAAQ